MVQSVKTIVVDASVVLKFQLNDEDCVSQATTLRDDFYQRHLISLVAPRLLSYEVVNGLFAAVRQKRLTESHATEGLQNILDLGIELEHVDLVETLKLSFKYNLASYDAAYLALSQHLKAELWTGDRVFYNKIRSLNVVQWIGNYITVQENN